MARETEGKELPIETISSGVRNLLKNPHLGFYVVAENQGEMVAENQGEMRGSLMVTTEWSDWRSGFFWWIQSVYVRPEFRHQGIYRRLYEYVKGRIVHETNVCGLRLYVERENTVAQSTYKALGMLETPYRIYEELVQR
jgi:ribosomal protein S18 acetylase RimI-like enzyme